MSIDLTPIQQNTKKSNGLNKEMDYLRFCISVQSGLLDKYTAEDVESTVALLINAQEEYIKNVRERIALYRRVKR